MMGAGLLRLGALKRLGRLHSTLETRDMEAGFQCAGCGEWNETTVDSSAGRRQQYVEDCQVCCKANVLSVSWDGEAAEFLISAELE